MQDTVLRSNQYKREPEANLDISNTNGEVNAMIDSLVDEDFTSSTAVPLGLSGTGTPEAPKRRGLLAGGARPVAG